MEKSLFLTQVDDPSADFYIHYTEVTKFETQLHQHNKSQLLYAEGGIVHVFINDRHWYLPARCYMWIPANQIHSILSYSKNITLYSFYFREEDDYHSFYTKTAIYFADDMLREMFMFAKKWNGQITSKQRTAFNFLKAIKSILPDLDTNKLPFSVQHPFPKDEKLIEIGTYLIKHIDRNFTIEEIAETFGISARSLSRRFKEQMGMNYVRFSRSLRITKALELIAENKYNMLQVALNVGYSSLSSFSNIFLKITGVRPTDYAKMLHR